MKILAFVAIALAAAAPAFSQSSAPAAPTLTAGAEFKGLRFDWDTVPGATWYQLEYRAHRTGEFVQQAGSLRHANGSSQDPNRRGWLGRSGGRPFHRGD